MKVYVYPADTTGCGWFRLLWPAQELIRQGHDITIMWPNDRGHFGARIEDDVVKSVQYPKDADLIVVQRVSHKHLAQALGWIRSQGVAVVMDIDDDLSSIHPTNPAWALMHPKSSGTGFSTDHSWNNTLEAARNSTMTVVSSDALTLRYRGEHGARVLHNRVPDHYIDIPHEDSDLIGWGASVLTHPDDGQEATTAVSRLVSEGYRFRMIGSGTEGISELFGIPEDKVDCAGPVPMPQWPNHLAQLGVGIAPLADTKFNRSKSSLKILEYAALGIPSVASDRVEYRLLHEQHGIGVLVDRPKHWYRELKKFVTDTPYRQDTGERNREAASRLTYRDHAWRWWEVWEEAVKLQRG